MIGHQDRVVVANQRLDGFGQLRRAGCAVARHGHAAQSQHQFAQDRLVERDAGRGVARGNGWMRVAHGIDVRTQAVDQKMHGQLGRGVTAPAEFPPAEIGDHHVLGRHHALAHAGGRREDGVRRKSHGDVSVGSGHVAVLVQPAPHDAQVAPVLCF